jgi:hypothetical protein
MLRNVLESIPSADERRKPWRADVASTAAGARRQTAKSLRPVTCDPDERASFTHRHRAGQIAASRSRI